MEGILQPSATQRTTHWTTVENWVLSTLAVAFLVISSWSRIRSSLHHIWLSSQSWLGRRHRDDAAQLHLELSHCFQTLLIKDWHLRHLQKLYPIGRPFFQSSTITSPWERLVSKGKLLFSYYGNWPNLAPRHHHSLQITGLRCGVPRSLANAHAALTSPSAAPKIVSLLSSRHR